MAFAKQLPGMEPWLSMELLGWLNVELWNLVMSGVKGEDSVAAMIAAGADASSNEGWWASTKRELLLGLVLVLRFSECGEDANQGLQGDEGVCDALL